LKPLHWLGSSRDDIREFPEDVRREIGFSLWLAQEGDRAINAVPLVGFGNAKVLEIVSDDASGTFRTVYTVRFPLAVYALHAFQKKSKRGIETPRKDTLLVRSRLRDAVHHYGENYEKEGQEQRNVRVGKSPEQGHR